MADPRHFNSPLSSLSAWRSQAHIHLSQRHTNLIVAPLPRRMTLRCIPRLALIFTASYLQPTAYSLLQPTYARLSPLAVLGCFNNLARLKPRARAQAAPDLTPHGRNRFSAVMPPGCNHKLPAPRLCYVEAE